MATYVEVKENPLLDNLKQASANLLHPLQFIRVYEPSNLRPDVVAGLTVAVILLPQAIAYALIAELPPQAGLYAAIVAAVVGALWGSSHHLQTGPTNAISLLILSTLVTTTTADPANFVVLAGLMAILVGIFQLLMGLVRMGVLVNFVSHSVIVGFSSGAGVLIAIKQFRHLFGLEFSSHSLIETVRDIFIHLPDTHLNTMVLGVGTILLILFLRRNNRKLPGPLIGMVVAAAFVGMLGLDQQGVVVIGELPRDLPPLAQLPLFDLDLIAQLSTGALAIAAIGLVEAMSIARSIASQTDQRLDSNQEFVGQGLANIAAGFFSGYPSSGSFTRSAVNFKSGAKTPLASILSGIFVLIAMLVFAPLAAFVPRTALAGVLILTAYGMINFKEILRIWRGTRGDAVIMLVTFLGTLFLHLEFAVLTGILFSFAIYIVKTSVPRVCPVVPDENFTHFIDPAQRPPCPQLAVIDILGDLYFGAVTHIEQAIRQYMSKNPEQRFLLLRMHSVNQCDFSGIHALESVVRAYREQGGDVFMVRVREHILELMKATGFYHYLGVDNFLSEDTAITHIFYGIIDPAVCIYECEARTFKECQNLPKRTYPVDIPLHTDIPQGTVDGISARELWKQLHQDSLPLIIDVREPREFRQGHIEQAQLMPLPTLFSNASDLPHDRSIIFVCRSGRRSTRAAYMLHKRGYNNAIVLQGGMLAWQSAGLLEAIDQQLQ